MASLSTHILVAAVSILATDAPHYQIATFRADVTIPIGHACMGGGISAARQIVDSLFASGVVLLGQDRQIVFPAVDWREMRNAAYDHWRNTLAGAAGASCDRVLLANVHQHDAPVVDGGIQRRVAVLD